MVSKFINKTLKRFRVFSQLDLLATIGLRQKSQLEGWASVYVYPKNEVKVSKSASIRVANGLLTFSKSWFEVQPIGKCVFEMEDNARLECLGNFDFARGSHCFVKKGASLRLGNDSRVGAGTEIACANEISIGNGVWISDNVKISDAEGKIVIEDGVWMGNDVQIVGNIKIGKNAVIGEGVKVTEDVGEGIVMSNN